MHVFHFRFWTTNFLHDLRNFYKIQTFYRLTIPTCCTATNIVVNFESFISIDIQVFYFQYTIYCGLWIYIVDCGYILYIYFQYTISTPRSSLTSTVLDSVEWATPSGFFRQSQTIKWFIFSDKTKESNVVDFQIIRQSQIIKCQRFSLKIRCHSECTHQATHILPRQYRKEERF